MTSSYLMANEMSYECTLDHMGPYIHFPAKLYFGLAS